MEKYKLQPLTEQEKQFAEENHNLIYSFIKRHGYSIEEHYNILVFGFLKAVQIYHRRKDLQKYDFPFISWQYMRSEIGNYYRMEKTQKRGNGEAPLSLDKEYTDDGTLYNLIGKKSVEFEVLEKESMIEILNSLTDKQRKIVVLKLDGYSPKEIFELLEIQSSTYYKEMQRIKLALQWLVG